MPIMQAIAVVGLVTIAAGGLMFGEAGSRTIRDGDERREAIAFQITGACLLLLGIVLVSSSIR